MSTFYFAFINETSIALKGRENGSKDYKWLDFYIFSPIGSDLLKLTRDDLVQICGPADGIRLFNALKSRCMFLHFYLFWYWSDGACSFTVAMFLLHPWKLSSVKQGFSFDQILVWPHYMSGCVFHGVSSVLQVCASQVDSVRLSGVPSGEPPAGETLHQWKWRTQYLPEFTW